MVDLPGQFVLTLDKPGEFTAPSESLAGTFTLSLRDDLAGDFNIEQTQRGEFVTTVSVEGEFQ